jgi:apolipoprotein N-acyltransferase
VIAPSLARNRTLAFIASILSGVAISMAWWIPGTIASALLGWAAACLLVLAVRTQRAYLPSYCTGLFCCTLGFYWVFPTVSVYADLGTLLAALLFALFVVGSAVQFLIFAFFHHNLGPLFDALALRSPTALVLSELVSVRIFQWHYGHTQVALVPLVQIADIAGAMSVSFLMFWLAEVLIRLTVFRERRLAFLLPPIALGVALGYGVVMIGTYSSPPGESQEVVLVQGNFGIGEKVEPDSVRRNSAKLLDLSRKAADASPGALVVWPESSILVLLPAEVQSVKSEPLLPSIGFGAVCLLGSYAEDTSGRRYNAAFATAPDGRVAAPYYKQILIPFGEYVPGSSLIPWLETLNANSGGFTAGTEPKVFEYVLRAKTRSPCTLKLSPLICYEDTIPALSRAATLRGAELLVNITNDAWFGRSVAAAEHHLIASFRAIENRRFLLRATNTGRTAVVDPLGRTIASLPPFTEGTLRAEVTLIDRKSAYTRFLGDWPWWGLFALCLGVVVVERWRMHKNPYQSV